MLAKTIYNMLAIQALLLVGALTTRSNAQEAVQAPDASLVAVQRSGPHGDGAPADALSPADWERVDAAVNRALAFLASRQQRDGSFATLPHGQPAVTSLCTLAFMAHGHLPGEGPYGDALSRAADYIVSKQKPNGLITAFGPEGTRITRNLEHQIGVAAAYNHAISSLTTAEIYGVSQSMRSDQVREAIVKALRATIEMQKWPKDRAADRGGWRYVDDHDSTDSDLSVTGWQLMFLRSARNAGFDVPREPIDAAVAYVQRCYSAETGAFEYATGGYNAQRGDLRGRGMAGAGILALGHAGFHDSPAARAAGQWVLRHDFDQYNDDQGFWRDRYHYSLFNCCQGMYQLGSPYWEEFFPPTVRAVLKHQEANGSWAPERRRSDSAFGDAYTTALVVLSLGASNQLLPIFQR